MSCREIIGKIFLHIIALSLFMIAGFVYSDQLPKVIKMEPPVYPSEARAAGATGKVVIKYEIDDSGRVESASVVKSSGSDVLDSAAIDSVMNYRFENPNYPKGASRPTYTKVVDFNGGATKQEVQHQEATSEVKYDLPPKLIETIPTIYPDDARRYHLEGVVDLVLNLNEEGRLENVKVLKGSGYAILDEAALETVKSYKFSSASLNGKNVASEKVLRIIFKLGQSDEEIAENKLANKVNLCGDRIKNTALREDISQLIKYTHISDIATRAINNREAELNQELAPYLKVAKGDQLSHKQKRLMDARDKIIARMHNDFGWDKVESIYIQSYCDTYTDKEIEDILTFYKSPTGQSMLMKGGYLNAKAASQLRAISATLEKFEYDTVQAAIADFE